MPRWVKGNSKGPQLHGTLKNNNANHKCSWRHSITFKIPPLSGVISHVNNGQECSWYGTMITPPSYLMFPWSSGVGLISPLTWKDKHLSTYLQLQIRTKLKDKEEQDRFNPLMGMIPVKSPILSRWFSDIKLLVSVDSQILDSPPSFYFSKEKGKSSK